MVKSNLWSEQSVIDVCCAHYFTVLLQKTLVDAIVILSVVVWYKIKCCPKETILFSPKKRAGGRRGDVIENKIGEKTNVFREKENYVR